MELSKTSKTEAILKALEQRLPNSACMYNIAKISGSWQQEMKYWIGTDIDSAIIVVNCKRNDWGQEISVSRPTSMAITPEIRRAFATSDAVFWSEPYCFVTVDDEIMNMAADISLEVGNDISVHPGYYYVMRIEEAKSVSKNFSFQNTEKVQLKRMEPPQGVNFLMKTWKFASASSEHHISKLVDRNLTAGVFEANQVVSGACLTSHGLLGMLATLPEYRDQQYGVAVMHHLMQKCAEQGILPSCTVEQRNEAANSFMRKIGFKEPLMKIYLVFYRKSQF